MPLQSLIGVPTTVEAVFEEITKKGVSKADAAILVGNWIIATAGRGPRVFSYKTDFPAADPDCVAEFVRSFVHQDWVDGENVVQAEETTGEEGFNRRFHRIEADLDGLARDVATAFLCLSSMRASLHHLLDEVRTELNLINATLGELSDDDGPRRPPFVFEGAAGAGASKFLGATRFFSQDVNVFQTPQGIMMLPSISGVKIAPGDNPRVQRVTDFARFLTDARVAKFFTDEATVTPEKFTAKFGDEVLESGAKVRDVVDILAPAERFRTPQAMLDSLADREGDAIRTSAAERESIASSLGVEAEAKIADAPVDRMASIPRVGRTALVGVGVTKVGDLAGKDAAAIATELRGKGVDVTTREVAGWVATAKTLVRVR